MYKTLLILCTLVLVSSNSLFAGDDKERLASALAAQPEEMQARYEFRHPQETLEFFGIKPGMTVVEALPGGGWYTKILLPYIGAEGQLIGADYSDDMYPLFGFFSEEQLEERKTFATDFPESAKEWGGENGAPASGFKLGAMPDEMKGTADAVLFIRALHNLARFEGQGGFLTAALQNAYDVLKPGGVVGVVQHEAREDKSDEFADGSHGYLKSSFVIEQMKAAGFELVAAADFNQNDKDQPSDTDIVWRLPPGLFTSRDNPELKAELTAIGESNRMTLKFRKPE
jgi:predicted methyltransferase